MVILFSLQNIPFYLQTRLVDKDTKQLLAKGHTGMRCLIFSLLCSTQYFVYRTSTATSAPKFGLFHITIKTQSNQHGKSQDKLISICSSISPFWGRYKFGLRPIQTFLGKYPTFFFFRKCKHVLSPICTLQRNDFKMTVTRKLFKNSYCFKINILLGNIIIQKVHLTQRIQFWEPVLENISVVIKMKIF